MSTSKAVSDSHRLMLQAVNFTARAHRHQLRKDGVTPYSAHPGRVAWIVRELFAIQDPDVIMAALLHDTIEDTTTDYDDLEEQFGPRVAAWVAMLSKDMRLPNGERETRYVETLVAADWQPQAVKLADILDNTLDAENLPAGRRRRTLERSRWLLEKLRPAITADLTHAFGVTERALIDAEAAAKE